MTTIKFGLGEKGRFSAKEILKLAEVDKKYFGSVGNGLSIGGINITDNDQIIRIPQSAEKLSILAPGLEPVDVDLKFTNEEVDRPIKTPEWQAANNPVSDEDLAEEAELFQERRLKLAAEREAAAE